MDFKTLKARQREERENYPINLGLRVHRALSWLDRAEQSDDDDARFIFLWIAFNAAYANEIGDRDGIPSRKYSVNSWKSWWTWTKRGLFMS